MKIDELLQKFMNIWHEWQYIEELKKGNTPHTKEWSKLWDKVNKEIPKVKKLIEKQFRILLGIKHAN